MNQACKQCPRRCGAKRGDGQIGYCGVPDGFRVARIALHRWEEPSISGWNGSGTVFFSGCNLRCVFCQNHEISHGAMGVPMDAEELTRRILTLRDEGAHNINLVTPTQYARQLVPILRRIKPTLGIPILYNCGGYESVETLRALEGLVDVYLPDLKYFSADLSERYSGAADYYTVASDALAEMLRQVGAPQFDENGLLLRGVVVRHLVLPGARADSIRLLEALTERFGSHACYLSLMSQYTPQFALDAPYPELHRRLTTFEYRSVLDRALELGWEGYFQSRESATTAFTPDFRASMREL